ncbi:hypothetical protein DOY81_004576 [Sarcophaga bullata]|nr:hypothetical protein DOY81_004576 [Sarcophaga bullata]
MCTTNIQFCRKNVLWLALNCPTIEDRFSNHFLSKPFNLNFIH